MRVATLLTAYAGRINYYRRSSSNACHACAYDVDDMDTFGCTLDASNSYIICMGSREHRLVYTYLLVCFMYRVLHRCPVRAWIYLVYGYARLRVDNIVAGRGQESIYGFKNMCLVTACTDTCCSCPICSLLVLVCLPGVGQNRTHDVFGSGHHLGYRVAGPSLTSD